MTKPKLQKLAASNSNRSLKASILEALSSAWWRSPV